MIDNSDNMDEVSGDVSFHGKVAKFPKNTKASKAYNFLEKVKITRNKIWYFIIEKEIVSDDKSGTARELQVIKYNNKQGVDCAKFIDALKKYYSNDATMATYINNLKIDGNENFSIIRNIPNVDVNGKKLINILSEDLIKLLYK